MRWGYHVALAVDQLANAILAGTADETISARSFRLAERDRKAGVRGRWWYAEKAVNALFAWQDLYKRDGLKHCERAFHDEMARKHMPAEYR